MRIRALKPGFFRNEDLCSLSPFHRLCFEGLWCCADRAGRLEDRPRRLKADIFPYDDLDIDALLWDLHARGFIVRYIHDGAAYICMPKWELHQHPRQDEGESVLPPPSPGDERINDAPSTPYPAGTGPSLSSDGANTRKRMGSGVLGSGKWEVGDGTSGVRAAETALVCLGPDDLKPEDERYLRFQSTYPVGRRVGGQLAKRAFQKAMRGKPAGHFDVMLAALEQHKRSQQWCEGKIPLMTTWLNQERWVQELPEPTAGGLGGRIAREAWCEHAPRCTTQAEHNLKICNEGRATRGMAPLEAS